MYSLKELIELIDAEIKGLKLPESPVLLYTPITYTLDSGGKRIRPALVLAACNLFSDSVVNAIPSALAVELFHNFTLIHDDIMDNAPLRRNRPTVFKQWGQNVAILSGDALCILAYQQLAKTDVAFLRKIFPIFNGIALNICEGQQMDMDFETAPFVTQEEYLRMIELKTAALLKGSLQIGGTIGGGSAQDIINLGEFGLNLGIAFQLQDDLLDAYGDLNVFGKQIGNDIVTNKKTFLAIKALSVAKGHTLELLRGYFNARDIEPGKKIAGVKNIYNELGIDKITENIILEYHNRALVAFDKINVKDDRKDILLSIAQTIMGRTS